MIEILKESGIIFSGSETKYADDISLLVLSSEVDLSASPLVKPVCLPSVESSQTYTGQTAVVSGWGLTDYYNGTFPDHLQHVRVDILGKQCKRAPARPLSKADENSTMVELLA